MLWSRGPMDHEAVACSNVRTRHLDVRSSLTLSRKLKHVTLHCWPVKEPAPRLEPSCSSGCPTASGDKKPDEPHEQLARSGPEPPGNRNPLDRLVVVSLACALRERDLSRGAYRPTSVPLSTRFPPNCQQLFSQKRPFAYTQAHPGAELPLAACDGTAAPAPQASARHLVMKQQSLETHRGGTNGATDTQVGGTALSTPRLTAR